MRVTEAARRERRNRVAAGDESAMLKLKPQAKGGKGHRLLSVENKKGRRSTFAAY